MYYFVDLHGQLYKFVCYVLNFINETEIILFTLKICRHSDHLMSIEFKVCVWKNKFQWLDTNKTL